jgi:hypothetical protein
MVSRTGGAPVARGRGWISRRTEENFLLGVQQDKGGAGRVDCQSGADSPFGIAEAQGWPITGYREACSPPRLLCACIVAELSLDVNNVVIQAVRDSREYPSDQQV